MHTVFKIIFVVALLACGIVILGINVLGSVMNDAGTGHPDTQVTVWALAVIVFGCLYWAFG